MEIKRGNCNNNSGDNVIVIADLSSCALVPKCYVLIILRYGGGGGATTNDKVLLRIE